MGVERRWQHLTRELDAAVLDAARWKHVCDALAAVTGGLGTAMLPLAAEARRSWIIHSDALDGSVQAYVRDGWYRRDPRDSAWLIARRRGFAVDFDIVDRDVMRRHPYYQDFLARQGISTFIGIHIPIGADNWAASIQRPLRNSVPDAETLELLPRLRSVLAAAARSAQAIAASGVDRWLSFFEGTDRGIAILSRDRRVRKMNESAENLMSSFVGGGGEIRLADLKAAKQLGDLTTAACAPPPRGPLPPPVQLPLAPGKSLYFDAVPLPSALQHFYSDLAAVLVVRMAEASVVDRHVVLAERCRLTPSEARLALHIGSGTSVREAADKEGIAFETARSRLKAVYAKTGTGRQSELALLVSEVTGSRGNVLE